MKNDLATDTRRTRIHTWLKTICAILSCILQCPVAAGAQSGCECDTMRQISSKPQESARPEHRLMSAPSIIQPFLLHRIPYNGRYYHKKNTHTHTRGRGLPLHHYFERVLKRKMKIGICPFWTGKMEFTILWLWGLTFRKGIKDFENGIFLFETSA